MSKTVEIPGGTAVLLERHELTPRKQLPVKSLLHRSADLVTKMATARRVVSPAGEVEENPDLPGEEVILTEHEADVLARIGYATSWAYLKSWTIPHPFPSTPDAFLDIPANIADAIEAAVQDLGGTEAAAEFDVSPEALTDRTSPTGVSAD